MIFVQLFDSCNFFSKKVSSVLGGGSGYGSAASYGVTDSYKYRKQGSFEQTNKSLDDQLKELDSQLLSKVGRISKVQCHV